MKVVGAEIAKGEQQGWGLVGLGEGGGGLAVAGDAVGLLLVLHPPVLWLSPSPCTSHALTQGLPRLLPHALPHALSHALTH